MSNDISAEAIVQPEIEQDEARDIEHSDKELTTASTIIALVETAIKLEQAVPVKPQRNEVEGQTALQEAAQLETPETEQAAFVQLNGEPALIGQMQTEAIFAPLNEEPKLIGQMQIEQAAINSLNGEPALIGQMQTEAPNLMAPVEESSTSCLKPDLCREAQASYVEPEVGYTLITTIQKLAPRSIYPIKTAPSQTIVQLPPEAAASLQEETAETSDRQPEAVIGQIDLTRRSELSSLTKPEEDATDTTFEQRSLEADQLDCRAADRLEAYTQEMPLGVEPT